tara:strand:- start:46 stop:252 length:207 start_codon:yes stop_codon:yes gene_type:complete
MSIYKKGSDYYASGQDTEEAKVFDVLTHVIVSVEADDVEDARRKVIKDLYCGDIDYWIVDDAEEMKTK